jgi:hypothetical protein
MTDSAATFKHKDAIQAGALVRRAAQARIKAKHTLDVRTAWAGPGKPHGPAAWHIAGIAHRVRVDLIAHGSGRTIIDVTALDLGRLALVVPRPGWQEDPAKLRILLLSVEKMMMLPHEHTTVRTDGGRQGELAAWIWQMADLDPAGGWQPPKEVEPPKPPAQVSIEDLFGGDEP